MTDEGKDFLNEVIKQPDLEIYNIRSIQILVEFFFDTYRRSILSKQFPLFVIQVIFFILVIIAAEDRINHLRIQALSNEEKTLSLENYTTIFEHIEISTNILYVGIAGLGLCQVINAKLQIVRMKADGWKYFTKLNA